MQTSSYRFIVKVLVVSAILSVAIKEIGPPLAIPATPTIVMTFVLLPTALMGLALGLQYRFQSR